MSVARRGMAGGLAALVLALPAPAAAQSTTGLLDGLAAALAALAAPAKPIPPPPPPPPGAPPPPPGALSPSYHGINGQFLWDAEIAGTGAAAEAYRTAQLQAMRGQGLTLVRYGAPWSLMEPSAPLFGLHAYDWAFGDTVALTLAREGVRWYPILGAAPAWAGGSPLPPLGCPQAQPAPAASRIADFAALAGAFTARYGRGGSFWAANPALTALPVEQVELFNEPNLGCFFNTGSGDAAVRYAAVYGAARAAIRARVADMVVVSGGLAEGADNASTRLVTPTTFVARMLAARPALASELDALGLHPYAPDAGTTFAVIGSMRATLDARVTQRSVPIEVNETGWFTQGSIPGDFWNLVPPISDAQRAAMLERLAVELPASDCGVQRLMPHTWISRELDPWYFHDWFGIVSRDGVRKQSAIAFGRGLRAARAATSTTVLDHC